MDCLVAPERLETDRLVIRSWLPGDGPAMSEAVCASCEHLRTFMRRDTVCFGALRDTAVG